MATPTNPSTASRESSEFEFVSGNGGNGGAGGLGQKSGVPKPPATMPVKQSMKNDPSLSPAKDKPPTSPTTDAPEGLFGWVRGTGGGLLSKVAEKTKSSVETVITTLDPQMKGKKTSLKSYL